MVLGRGLKTKNLPKWDRRFNDVACKAIPWLAKKKMKKGYGKVYQVRHLYPEKIQYRKGPSFYFFPAPNGFPNPLKHYLTTRFS